MHELSVTRGIFNLVMQEAKRSGASKVCTISLKMGAALDYFPEIIQDYFDILSEDTVAAGAKIKVDMLPVTMVCEDCKNEYVTMRYNPFCTKCSSRRTTMKSGNEFYIENIEIEE